MSSTVLELYKIMGPAGYSGGGERPRFSSKGKTWHRMSDVQRHLSELHDQSLYVNCEIVSLRYELKSSDRVSVSDAIHDLNDKHRQLMEKRAAWHQARQHKEELDEYKRLHAKFDGFLGDPD